MRSFPYLVIFLAGGLGSVCRYGLSSWGLPLLTQMTGMVFPWGTFLVNVLGCFVIGIASVLTKNVPLEMEEGLRVILIVGFLGGFTTFSSYIGEGASLLLQTTENQLIKAVLYLMGSVLTGLVAFWIGEQITSRYFSG